MFPGSETTTISIDDHALHVRTMGRGPALLLLHGFPQTHMVWHAVAPRLAERFTLVMPDLPGYGRSRGPVPDAAHVAYSKRRMAEVIVAAMAALGHGRFHVAGHDRGGRVAYRMVLDHPDRVARAAFLDIVPTLDVWDEMDWASAIEAYHWPLLAQPAPVPERLIGADPDFYIEHLLSRWAGDRAALDERAVADYIGQFRDASVCAAACADYRAGASVDREHDARDRAEGRRIARPCAVVWGTGYHSTKASSPLAVWQNWADVVDEYPLACGHFVAEEQPDACAAALLEHFDAEAA